jgi:hypothetical protein
MIKKLTIKYMNKFSYTLIFCFYLFNQVYPQNWTLKLKSNVELRTWKLTSKADKTEKPLAGAIITLLKDNSVITQTTSDGNGDFVVNVPPNGEYILAVSYSGCNTKRFYVNTFGIPEDIAKLENFNPSFSIGGFVMAKPFPGINYSGLEQPLVKVAYENKIKNFDDVEAYTETGLGIVGKIADAENTLIQDFCGTNKSGDIALVKPDCPLAKMLYEKAITIIPGEAYPVEQLAKVGQCLKDKEENEEKAVEEAAKKAEEEKLAKEKAAAEKLEKEKQLAEQKAAAQKAANEKALADKAAKEKALADKLEKDRIAKEQKELAAKALAEKAEKERLAKSQKETEKKTVTAKSNPEKPKTAEPKKVEPKKPEPKKETAVKEPAKTSTPKSTPPQNEVKAGTGDAKHKVPQVLGANKYKDAITKADGYLKMKRYTEAKTAYEEALLAKPNDSYALSKLEVVKKALNP